MTSTRFPSIESVIQFESRQAAKRKFVVLLLLIDFAVFRTPIRCEEVFMRICVSLYDVNPRTNRQFAVSDKVVHTPFFPFIKTGNVFVSTHDLFIPKIRSGSLLKSINRAYFCCVQQEDQGSNFINTSKRNDCP